MMLPGDSGNLVITGFMGTGKTAVGREVARRLGRPFMDMDAEIEARVGKAIPRIFAEDGEAAFRKMETSLCLELSQQRGWVIATGGGALLEPANRAAMMHSGTVVCLTCDVDEILRRVRDGDAASAASHPGPDRPLLHVADQRAEIERLLEARRPAYAAIPWQLDTTALSVDEAAERLIELARASTLVVHHPGGEYPIHVGNGLLGQIGNVLRAAGLPEGGQVALVSNPVVAPLYGEQVEDSLRSAGLRPFTCSIPDGEQHKTLATVAALYDRFLEGALDRSGTVLSLGGGVTGDVAGFAAATYMRGVRFVQVPTTLLAMADASVGGKTGVDLPQGKNLVGAFKQPALVLMDPAVLATLPAGELRSGMAEVIKHGVIGAPDLFSELETGTEEPSSWWKGDGVARMACTLRVKIKLVEEDPFEKGRRAALNLGHTVGHTLERLSGFSLRHGEAVAVGMVTAARIAVVLGLADPSVAGRIEAGLTAWGLPVRCPPFRWNEIWAAMAHDKKRQGRSLRWVLPHAIGRVEIVQDVPPTVVESVLHGLGARSDK
jgi:shikimate kinase/3-dehydroquinate synthase